MSLTAPTFVAAEKTMVEHQEKASDTASGDVSTDGEWTEAEERAVRRKMDLHIVPLVTVLYLLCFLDRANIGNARIAGLATDLKLQGYDFNWALTIFYLVYAAVEVPSNIILKRVGPTLWIPFLVFGFGIVSLCTAFVNTWGRLMVARVFLGIFEGGTMPGIAFYLSTFYRRKELLFRIGIFVSAASMAGAFGGLFAAGLSRIPSWGAPAVQIATWRNIFFFEGLITVLASLAAPFLMTANPESCKFLSDRERFIAVERLHREHKSSPNEKVTWQHIKMAIFNINTTICAFGFFVINVTVQSLSLFMPTLLNDLGWTATTAQLYTVPPYVLACLVSILIAFVSDRTRQRGLYLALFAPIGIIGFALLRAPTTTAQIRYMGVFFVTIGAFPGGPAFLTWGLNNAAGPPVRAVAGAYIVTVGTLGAVLATWTYLPADAPRYPKGHSINLGTQAAAGGLALVGIAYVLWENRMRNRGKRDHRLETAVTEEQVRDLGHKHPEFRYIP